MRIHQWNELRTLLPLLLGITLLISLAVAACSTSTAEQPATDQPAAEDQTGSHADDAATDDHDGDANAHDGAADDHEDHAAADHDEPEQIVVTMTDQLTFGPEEIVVPAGQPVRLVISNDGSALHDFTVDQIPVTHIHHEGDSMDSDHMAGEGHDEFDLHMALDGGDAGVLEFIPGEPGEYVFHCTVPGHTENGMHGELIVRAN